MTATSFIRSGLHREPYWTYLCQSSLTRAFITTLMNGLGQSLSKALVTWLRRYTWNIFQNRENAGSYFGKVGIFCQVLEVWGIYWANILRRIHPYVLMSFVRIPHFYNWGPDLNKTDLSWLCFKHLWALQLYQVFIFLIAYVTFNHLQLVSGPQFLFTLCGLSIQISNNQSTPLSLNVWFPAHFPNAWIIGPTMAFSSTGTFFQVTTSESFSSCLVPGILCISSIFFCLLCSEY